MSKLNKQVVLEMKKHAMEIKEDFLFQKIVFILQKEYGLTNYSFLRADYGPFSRELEEDLLIWDKFQEENDSLLNEDVIKRIRVLSGKSKKELIGYIFEKYDIFQYELRDIIA